MLTVFSSSNYCGTERNVTGYALITGPDCTVKPHILRTIEEASIFAPFNIFKLVVDENTKKVTQVIY